MTLHRQFQRLWTISKLKKNAKLGIYFYSSKFPNITTVHCQISILSISHITNLIDSVPCMSFDLKAATLPSEHIKDESLFAGENPNKLFDRVS